MKKSNYYYTAFFAVLALSAFWFTGKMLWSAYSYLRMDQQASIRTIDWSVKELSSDQFAIQARFIFVVDTNSYQGTDLLGSFRNPWTAHDAIKEQPKYKKTWYNSSNPNNAALEKKLPLKDSLYALCLWAILIYFYFLNVYVSKAKREQ